VVDGKGHLYLYGEIGWEVRSLDFVQQLNSLGAVDEIAVHFDSVGGSVFEATAIYAVLLAHQARIVGVVEGVCASAAAFVLQAADDRQIGEASQFLIHDSRGGMYGTASELEDYLKLLRNTDEIIKQIFARRSGLDAGRLAELCSRDSWLTAAEAKALGLVDTVITATRPQQPATATTARQAANRISADDLQAARNAYTTWAAIARHNGGQPVTKPNTAPANSAAPVPETPAAKTPENQTPPPAVTPPVPAAVPAATPPAKPEPTQAAVPARDPKDAAEVVRLCTRCGCPDKAADYLEAGTPLDQVRAALLELQIASRPVSNQVGNPEPTKKQDSPIDKFGKEYDENREIHAKFGVAREEYVRSRCLDEGMEPPAKAK
jgi:ATP-dependent Clp endopeptidase proteolytic subunit ClpP